MDADKFFECGNCGTLHEDYDDAKICCIPSAKQVYVCGNCEERFDSEVDAERCCVLPEVETGASKTQLRQKHGTPEDFRRAVEMAIIDGMVSLGEGQAAIRKYQREYDNAA